MQAATAADVTGLLLAWLGSDSRAVEQLTPPVYRKPHWPAHARMRGERSGHTLQTTALVHGAYLRLAAMPDWKMAKLWLLRALWHGGLGERREAR